MHSEKEQDIIELTEALKRDGHNEREIETVIREAEKDQKKDIGPRLADEENLIAKEILNTKDVFASEERDQPAGENRTQPRAAAPSSPEMEMAAAAYQAETQTTTELTEELASAEQTPPTTPEQTEAKADPLQVFRETESRNREITGQKPHKDDASVPEYQALTAAFKKAAQAARVAFRKGNKEGVEKAKAQMRDALTKAKGSRRTKAQRSKDIRAIEKLSRMRSNIAVDYQKKIRDLMDGLDFKNITPKKWEQLKGLQDYIEREGVPLSINPARLSELKRLTAIPLKSLDNEQIAVLRRQLEELTALGKLKASLKYKYNERKRAELRGKILSTTSNLDPYVKLGLKKRRIRDKFKLAMAFFGLNTLHTPRVADMADGYADHKGEQAKLIKRMGQSEQAAIATTMKRQESWLAWLQENGIELPVEDSASDIRMSIAIRIREVAGTAAKKLMEHYGLEEPPVLTADEEKIIEHIRR